MVASDPCFHSWARDNYPGTNAFEADRQMPLHSFSRNKVNTVVTCRGCSVVGRMGEWHREQSAVRPKER